MKKKIVFISGSSSGLGFELSKYFCEENYIVIMNGRDRKKVVNASKKIKNSYIAHGDLGAESDCEKVFKKIKKKFSRIDLIICNAGVSNFKNTNDNYLYAFKNNLFSNSILLSKASTR